MWWIRQAILQALAEQSRIVRVPLNRAGTLHRIGKRANALLQELGREPTHAEIADGMDITEEEVAKTMSISQTHLSLDAPLTPGEDNRLLDYLPDTINPTPDEQTFEKALTESIEEALSQPQGARGEDPAPLLRARRQRADDARGDRRAARHHARARAADQGEGAVAAAARVAGARRCESSCLGSTHSRRAPRHGQHSSFDVTTGVDLQEVDNAVNQAQKEIAQRYDFKGSKCTLEFKRAESDADCWWPTTTSRCSALFDVLQAKLIKRGVPVKNLDSRRDRSRPAATPCGARSSSSRALDSETAKKVAAAIKDAKFKKVQASIQGEQVRVTSPSSDELQEVIALLRRQDFGVELKFGNYR